MRIELVGLSKSFGSYRVLDELSMGMEPGRVVAIIGLNGAGKTTLLRCLATLLVPTAGSILLDGHELRRNRLDLRRRLAFLADVPAVLGDMTAAQHVGMCMRLYDVWKPGMETVAIDRMSALGVLELCDSPLSLLSRGQVYKVALAALVAVNPDLWLLDEPFASGMDPVGINFFRTQARQAADSGKTVVFSTQILDLAEGFADDVCVLDGGRVRYFGPLAAGHDRLVAMGALLARGYSPS